MTETCVRHFSGLPPVANGDCRADLDGALLISNDVFDGTKVAFDGKVTIPDRPGIGRSQDQREG